MPAGPRPPYLAPEMTSSTDRADRKWQPEAVSPPRLGAKYECGIEGLCHGDGLILKCQSGAAARRRPETATRPHRLHAATSGLRTVPRYQGDVTLSNREAMQPPSAATSKCPPIPPSGESGIPRGGGLLIHSKPSTPMKIKEGSV